MTLQSLRLGVRSLLRKDAVERELDDELRFHVEMQTAQNLARGMSPAEARTAALRTFGGVEKTKEQCREVRRTRWLEDFFQDLRYGARAFRSHPGFAAVVVLTLALGIGANTAIFSVVHSILLQPLPYEDSDQLVLLRHDAPAARLEDVGVSPLEMADYRGQSRSLAGLAEHHTMWFNLLRRGEPERVQTGVVSANFFQLLGIRPILGRDFIPEDEKPGAEPVLVLSYGYWQRSHGSDPKVIGQVFEMNDKAHRVIGVLPPVPLYPEDDEVYMPTVACPFRSAPHANQERGMRMLTAFGRLQDGASLEQAGNDVGTIAARMAKAYPESYPAAYELRAALVPLRERMVGAARPTLLILLGTVGLVLLIVCANVANLTLARLLGRQRELAVRSALGAGRGRLIRQLLTESTLLALTGGLLGLLLAAGALRLLLAFAANFTPRASEIGIDGPVLLFTLLVALATGIASGSLPALARRDLSSSLKEGGDRATTGTGGLRLRNGLIVVQLALSFVLLIGAGLMLRTLFELSRVDPGFHPENVVTAGLDLDWSKYDTPEKMRDVQTRLLARVRALPGIETAALASTFPLNDSQPWNVELQIEGRPRAADTPAPLIDLRVASTDYFRTIGVPLLRGRTFQESDGDGALEVVIVNQSMARRFWGDQNPVGRRISLDDGETWRTVIGVVGNVTQYGLDHGPTDEVYRPLQQFPILSTSLVARTSAPLATMEKSLRAAVLEVDPEQPLYEVQTLEQARAASLAPPRLTTTLLGLFAGLALLVTTTGIAGLIAFSVNRRTQEIGIRMALGAAQGTVLWMVLRQAAVLVLAGLALGVAGALIMTRLLAGLLFGVGPTDPATFLSVALVLLTVATFACLVPARRATAVQPVMALRA